MRSKEFIISEKTETVNKTRNPVAKNLSVTTSGAGKHKDKKRNAKMGVEKHKKQPIEEQRNRNEVQIQLEKAKQLLKGARQLGDKGTIDRVERAIANLERELETAQDAPQPKTRTPIPAGYKYDPYTDVEFDGDNSKIYHTVVTPDGERVDVDFTPYDKMTGRDIELWIKLGMPKGQGGRNLDSETLERMAQEKGVMEDQVSEVSKDYAERERAGSQIAKIIDSNKGTQWDDYSPEELKQIQQLAKITGRRHGIWQTKKLGGEMQVGRIIDLMSKYVQMKQRDSGQMPEFTGRAPTAKAMSQQIAVQTNGETTWRPGTTWTSGRTGIRHRDPQDHIVYKDKQSYDDAWQWIESKGKKVHYKNNFDDLRTAIQIGSYIVEPSSRTRSPFGGKPETEHSVSVRSVKAIGQPTRTKQDITDQQAAAIRDIANTRGENAMKMIQALIDVLDGEEDIKRVIDQSKKIDPRDKAKLDKIIAGAGNFKESKSHISPSGVKTNMDPSDDDYAINYGKKGLVAKDRKARGVDVKTGNKKVDESNVDEDEYDDAISDYLSKGGKITYVKPNKPKHKPGLGLASKHIGGGGDGYKASRTGRGANTQGKPVVGLGKIKESEDLKSFKRK